MGQDGAQDQGSSKAVVPGMMTTGCLGRSPRWRAMMPRRAVLLPLLPMKGRFCKNSGVSGKSGSVMFNFVFNTSCTVSGTFARCAQTPCYLCMKSRIVTVNPSHSDRVVTQSMPWSGYPLRSLLRGMSADAVV